MIFDAITQSTLQGYALLGASFIEAAYANLHVDYVQSILVTHRQRVTDALQYWGELSSEPLSNLEHILYYDPDTYVSSATFSNCSAAIVLAFANSLRNLLRSLRCSSRFLF